MLLGRHNSAFNRINLSRVSGGGGGGSEANATSAKCLTCELNFIFFNLNCLTLIINQ